MSKKASPHLTGCRLKPGITGNQPSVFERLVGQKFVRTSSEGPRGRIEFQLTAAGRRWLAKRCADLAEAELTGDFDSVLRKGLLIAFFHKDSTRDSRLFRIAASERIGRELVPAVVRSGAETIAQMYAHLRKAQAALVATTEAEVLKQAARALNTRSNHKG